MQLSTAQRDTLANYWNDNGQVWDAYFAEKIGIKKREELLAYPRSVLAAYQKHRDV